MMDAEAVANRSSYWKLAAALQSFLLLLQKKRLGKENEPGGISISLRISLNRPRVYLKTPNAPGQRAFLRCAASFFLEIRQYSCEKMSCATQKSLAAGHIMSFQIHPRKPLRFSWIFPAKLKATQNF